MKILTISTLFKALIFLFFVSCANNSHAQSSLGFNLPSSNYSQSTYWVQQGANAERAFNLSGWNAGNYNTHWIQVDLGQSQTIHTLTFFTGQHPSGNSWHQVYVSDSPIGNLWSTLMPVASRSGWSQAMQPMTLNFTPVSGRYVQIVANSGPSWTDLNHVRINPDEGAGPVTAKNLATGVLVSWVDNSDREKGFTVFRKEPNTTWRAVHERAAADGIYSTIDFLDQNVRNGMIYEYKIRTDFPQVNHEKYSNPVSIVNTTTPDTFEILPGFGMNSAKQFLDFGLVNVGSVGDKVIVLKNTTQLQTQWSIAVGGFFSVVGSSSGTLDAGASHALTLRYAPTQPGPHAATARFNIGGQIHQRELSGRGSAGEIAGSSTLTGRVVVFANGLEIPFEKVNVKLSPMNGADGGFERSTITGVNGNFDFAKLNAGSYLLVASPTGRNANIFSEVEMEVVVQGATGPITVVIPSVVSEPAVPILEPVILVRGIGKAGDKEDKYWEDMRFGLGLNNEFWVLDPNRHGVWNLNGEDSYVANAIALRNYIAQEVVKIKNLGYNVTGIHLVAHSMGGLTCRQMISNDIHQKNSTLKLPPVKTFITLSTPHAGSQLADAAMGFSWTFASDLWQPGWKSTQSCVTQGVRAFSPAWPMNSGIRVAVAAGTRSQLSIKYSAADLIFVGNQTPDEWTHDGAVALASSFGYFMEHDGSRNLIGLRSSNGWRKNYTFPQAKPSSGWLLEPPKEFPLNHDNIKEHNDVVTWVKGILRNRLPSPALAQAMSAKSFGEPMLMAMAEEEPIEFNGVPVDQFSLTLDLMEIVSANLPLSGGGMAQWMIGFSDAAAIVRLERPNGGGWISEAGPGVDWEIIDEEDGDGRLLVITLHEPEAGLWGIELDGAEQAEAAEVWVSVMEEGGPAFEAEVGGLVAAGAAVPMLAAASWDNGLTTVAVTGGSVEATVIDPNGIHAPRTLPDDGLNGDGAADDGVHGLLADEFSEPGIYDVIFRYNGTHPDTGEAFRRAARGSFTRAAAGGFIAGVEGHRTVDADDDGYPEAIILDVRVDNLDTGSFTLAGTFTEPDGDGSFQAVTEFHRSEAEAGIVNLVFDKRNLPMGRECGSFEISELRLLRADGDREWLHDHPPGYAVETRMFNGFSRHLRVSGDFDFGWVKVGRSATGTLRIHNDGWMPMLVGEPVFPEGFSGSYEGEIEAGGFVDVEVSFEPAAATIYGGGFEVPSNANAGAEVEAQWSGVGYNGILLNDWLEEKGVPEGDRDPLADPGKDGVPNLLAYLFNIAPMGGGGNLGKALPAPRVGEDGQGRYLALRYRHHKDAERLTVTMETCDDLQQESWRPVTDAEIIELGDDPDTGDRVREYRMRITDGPKGFVRLSVREER